LPVAASAIAFAGDNTTTAVATSGFAVTDARIRALMSVFAFAALVPLDAIGSRYS
jgi:hypothetical protein